MCKKKFFIQKNFAIFLIFILFRYKKHIVFSSICDIILEYKICKEVKHMANKVIGIEGLVGSGKTSICKELIKIIPNSILLHGGNLYRGIVYAVMQRQKEKIEDVAVLQTSFSHIDIKKVMDILNQITELFIMQDYAKDLLFNSTTDIQIASARSFLNRINEELKTLYIPTLIENV